MAGPAIFTSPPASVLETLRNPSPTTCHTTRINFAAHGFSEHESAFALLIHDLLTPSETHTLRLAAETAAQGTWSRALIQNGSQQVLASNLRSCDRILWSSPEIASALLAKILPHLPEEIVTLQEGEAGHVTSDDEVWSAATWRLERLNERLRFLRYEAGMYFRQHSDGFFVTDDESEVSFLTVHLYLQGSEDLQGGATRFFGEDRPGHVNVIDVDPRPGACLVFQHHDLVHSGEDVVRGTKYTVRTDVMYRRVPDP